MMILNVLFSLFLLPVSLFGMEHSREDAVDAEDVHVSVGIEAMDVVINQCPICCSELSDQTRYQLPLRVFLASDSGDGSLVPGTICGHVYCKDCLSQVITQGRSECPLCRSYILGMDIKKIKGLPEDPALNEELLSASSSENGHQVRFLLMQGANPFYCSKDGFTPLHCAVMARNITGVIELLQAVPFELLSDYVNLPGGRDEATPLYLAAQGGFVDIIKILLTVIPQEQRIASVVGARTIFGDSALIAAFENNQLNAVRMLVSMTPVNQRYACLNTRHRWGMNVIHLAVITDSIGMLRLLLSLLPHEQRIRLINEPVDGLLCFDDKGATALQLAVKRKKTNCVSFLIEHGATATV